MGSPHGPEEPIREDELEVVPLLRLGLSSGILDQVWSTRFGRGSAEGLGLIAGVEKAVWPARFRRPGWPPAPTSRPPGSGLPS